MENRFKTLKAEYESGLRELAELESRQTTIRQTMERIGAAIREIEAQLKTQR